MISREREEMKLQTSLMENTTKEKTNLKNSYKWVFEKKYSHHYSFRVENENGECLWHESFHTIAEAKNAIPKMATLDLNGWKNAKKEQE